MTTSHTPKKLGNDAALKQWRRLRAVELSQEGWSGLDIAQALHVSKTAVSRWLKTARQRGEKALLSRPRPGSPPKLSPIQLGEIPEFLCHGAEAYGFAGELWTCARVARVIELLG